MLRLLPTPNDSNDRSRDFETYAQPLAKKKRFPHLDEELRMLVARCLAVDENRRPSLRDLLNSAESAVGEKTEAVYATSPSAAKETDAVFREVVQKLILNEDTGKNNCPPPPPKQRTISRRSSIHSRRLIPSTPGGGLMGGFVKISNPADDIID